MAIADDGDCDGALTADDCDDDDTSLGAVAADADCDGTLTADDCNDEDFASTIVAEDADCDGFLTEEDCDDDDADINPDAEDILDDDIDNIGRRRLGDMRGDYILLGSSASINIAELAYCGVVDGSIEISGVDSLTDASDCPVWVR